MGKELLAVRFDTIESSDSKHSAISGYVLRAPHLSTVARSCSKLKRSVVAQQDFARQTIILKRDSE